MTNEYKWQPYPKTKPPVDETIFVTIKNYSGKAEVLTATYLGENQFSIEADEDEKITAWMLWPEPYAAPSTETVKRAPFEDIVEKPGKRPIVTALCNGGVEVLVEVDDFCATVELDAMETVELIETLANQLTFGMAARNWDARSRNAKK
nr:MAG TPA: hypothetical protein [Bacteriophage sp.]